MTKKERERAPAMQFYFRQFAGDEAVMCMDLDTVGAHILLMCAAGASKEGYKILYNKRSIRTRLRNPSEADFERILSQLLAGSWKVSEDGKWLIQDGMRRILLKQKEFSKKQIENAKRRWGMPNQCQMDAKLMPNDMPKACSSSSSSSSSSKSIKKGEGNMISVGELNKKTPPPPLIKFLDFVFLTQTQVDELTEKLGKQSFELYVKALDNHLTNNPEKRLDGPPGQRYENHGKTIELWWEKDGKGQKLSFNGHAIKEPWVPQMNNGPDCYIGHMPRVRH